MTPMTTKTIIRILPPHQFLQVGCDVQMLFDKKELGQRKGSVSTR